MVEPESQFRNRPEVTLVVEKGRYVPSCGEISCRFNFENGCTNPEVEIDDDFTCTQYCNSYESVIQQDNQIQLND